MGAPPVKGGEQFVNRWLTAISPSARLDALIDWARLRSTLRAGLTMAGMEAVRDFHIGQGGLLRRFERAVRLTTAPRQIATAISITWIPLMVLSLVHERMTGAREPLVYGPSLHVRLLVAVPVLLVLDQMFPRVCRNVLAQLISQSFVPDAAQDRFDRVLQSATRLADSMWPELLLAVLAVCLGIGSLVGFVPTSMPSRVPGQRAVLTAAHIWYALADWPLLQFLLWRSLWRWAIWVRVLYGLSRIDLQLVPTHGDRRCGISFLRLPSMGYCAALLFAASSILCADQAGRVAFGASFASFAPLIIIFATVGTLVAFGPLMVFSPQLYRARREALTDHDALNSGYGRSFQRRWIGKPGLAEQLQSGTTQPLTDLAEIYRETIDRLHFLLFDRRDLIVLLISTLLPMVPVILVHMPREEWQKLIGIFTGGALR